MKPGPQAHKSGLFVQNSNELNDFMSPFSNPEFKKGDLDHLENIFHQRSATADILLYNMSRKSKAREAMLFRQIKYKLSAKLS